MKNSTTSNGTTYTSVTFTIGKTIWTILEAKGKSYYVSVSKKSPTAATLGKEFPSFESAMQNYKTVEMRVQIKLAQLNIQA